MSCSISAASVTPRPEPPYSSGTIIPSQPACAKAFTNSNGYSALLSFSSQYSGGKERDSAETSLRISSCCSVSAKSMAGILRHPAGAAYDGALMTFVERMIGAARLDVRAYEEVEADQGATSQALAVVVLAAVAAGIGSGLGVGLGGLLAGALASILSWLAWAWLVWFIGTKWLREAQTDSHTRHPLPT